MKNYFLILVILFITNNLYSQTNWVNKTTYNVNNYNNFGNIKFFDAYTGYSSSTQYPVKNNIFKTINGGQNWTLIPGPNQDEGAFTVFFRDVNTVYCMVNQALYKSSNSGTTWILISTIDSLSQYPSCNIFFKDDLNGYITFGQKMVRTTNGGSTWTHLNYIPEFTAYSTYFFDQNNFFVASGYPDGYTSPSKLLKTENGGLNWFVKIDLSIYDGSMINNLKFINNNIGICVSELPYAPAYEVVGRVATNLFITTDGGNTWSRKAVNFPYFKNASISEDLSINIVCSNGFLYHSEDLGNSFSKKY